MADQVYSRKARAADHVLQKRATLEEELDKLCETAESEAIGHFKAGDEASGLAVLNRMAVEVGGKATAGWVSTWQELMVKFVDGKITTAEPSNEVCGCKKQSAAFGDAWKAKVISDAGSHYREPDSFDAPRLHDKPTRPKLSIRGVAP